METWNSYGLLCYDRHNKKTLVIQRINSPEFIHFIRGLYMSKDLNFMFERMTVGEHELVKDILQSSNLRKTFREIIPKFYYKNLDYYVDGGVKMFEENRDTIIDLVNTVQPSMDYDWIWPKGKINDGENPLDCAIRETFEETGYKIPINQIRNESVTFEITTFLGARIVTTYYLADCDSKMIQIGEPDYREVRQSGWYDYNFLKDRLPRSHSLYFKSLIN